VVDAFAYFADDSTTETERFARYFDCFFDCMIVCCFTVFWTPETDLRPYHSPRDNCLKVTNSGIIHAVTWSHTHTHLRYTLHTHMYAVAQGMPDQYWSARRLYKCSEADYVS